MELRHVGVKGMKWGVRKKKYSSAEIHGARSRQDQLLREAQRHNDMAELSTSSKARSSAEQRTKKLVAKWQTSEDRVTATRMTRGEKAAALIIAGPLGLIPIGLNRGQVKSVAKEVDALRKL